MGKQAAEFSILVLESLVIEPKLLFSPCSLRYCSVTAGYRLCDLEFPPSFGQYFHL